MTSRSLDGHFECDAAARSRPSSAESFLSSPVSRSCGVTTGSLSRALSQGLIRSSSSSASSVTPSNGSHWPGSRRSTIKFAPSPMLPVGNATAKPSTITSSKRITNQVFWKRRPKRNRSFCIISLGILPARSAIRSTGVRRFSPTSQIVFAQTAISLWTPQVCRRPSSST